MANSASLSLLAVQSVTVGARASIAGDRLASEIDAVEIVERLNEINSLTSSWQVEYEGEAPETPYRAHRLLAVRGPAECYFAIAKGPVDQPAGARGVWDLKEDLFRQYFLVRGDVCDWFEPGMRKSSSFSLRKGDPLPAKIEQDIIFIATGLWPFPDRASPKVFGRYEAVVSRIDVNQYVVRPNQELCGGRWCHVLESRGRDVLWIDCQRGAVIMERRWFNPVNGRIAHRIVLSEHREQATGFWMPMKIRSTLFSDSPGRFNDELGVGADIDISASITVRQFAVGNAVDRGLFDVPEAEPGAIEMQQGGGWRQVEPYGYELIDDLATHAYSDNVRFVGKSMPAIGWAVDVMFFCLLTYLAAFRCQRFRSL